MVLFNISYAIVFCDNTAQVPVVLHEVDAERGHHDASQLESEPRKYSKYFSRLDENRKEILTKCLFD